jgi:hypothetical protein
MSFLTTSDLIRNPFLYDSLTIFEKTELELGYPIVIEPISFTPDDATIAADSQPTGYPIITYTEFFAETIQNEYAEVFKFSYLDTPDLEHPDGNFPIDPEKLLFADNDEVVEGNGNNAAIRLFPSSFDISADYSIKISTGAKLSNLLSFEYDPDTQVLQQFLNAIGDTSRHSKSFRRTGGIMNCFITEHNTNIALPKVSGYILKPTNDNVLQYKARISIEYPNGVLGGPDTNELQTDLLIRLSFVLIYQIY